MQPLGGKTVIRHTYENTVATGLFHDVILVTDSDLIYEEITSNGGKAMMSVGKHESGSDRIAEAARDMSVDVIVNVQGDEPFVERSRLKKLLDIFVEDTEEKVGVASMMQILEEKESISDPNFVKVVVDKNMNALMFSRSVLPYPRATDIAITHYEHIGVYAFRKQALMNFTAWPMTPLEAAEKIECLRYLENGLTIRMVLSEYMGVEIDAPGDLIKAEEYFQKHYNKQ